MNEPTVPLHVAEMIFVSMAVITQEIEGRTDYPTANLHLILDSYAAARDKHLKAKGWSDGDIKLEQAAALDAVTQFLDERQMKDADTDFDAWTRELTDGDNA
jgi:hypothetical protein